MSEAPDVQERRLAGEDGAPLGERDISRLVPRPGGEKVLMTGVGLQIPADLSFEDWERAGRQLSGIVDSSAWWLGDWLIYGKQKYGDQYQRTIRAAGLQYQTLRNYAWVARRFDLSRRRQKLTFQHHAEVASLPLAEQDMLLEQAENSMWTTKQLRNAIRERRENGSKRSSLVTTSSRIEVPENRLGIWRRAADQLGVDFDKWVLTMLDRAADEVLSDS